jgi:uncharacterized sporulation protein YeaH/YhbH (DUF444 family)
MAKRGGEGQGGAGKGGEGRGGFTVQCARVQERDDFAKDLQAHGYTQKQKEIPAML